MSPPRAQRGGDGRQRPPRGAAPPLVAVLERRGRFMIAEPLFPSRADSGRERPRTGGGGRGRGQITVRVDRSGPNSARAGDLVLVSAAARSQPARVLRVIGRPHVARDVIEALMLDRGLRRRFTDAVERDARAAAERVRAEPGARRDLRELPTFTIDPASARDFDDAISAEALGDGRARIWVHIADVAAHVTDGSHVDREARSRATSVYVPGAVEPMLPHALSSEACSLQPGVDRAAVTVELEVDGERVRRSAFHRSLVRSDVRLDYEQVDRIFAGAESAREPWAGPLRIAREVASALGERRERSGALAIESAEPEFQFDERGDVVAVNARSQTESHRLIEHLMIAANEAVAELLQRRGVPCLYRVHERPEPDRVRRLADQLATLEVPTPPLPEPMSSTQAADLLGAMSVAVERHVARAGHGGLALGGLVLRSLKQAYYSPVNLGHAGLHSSAYCHFTSPIRRYPDLVCHRALLEALGEGERAHPSSELSELGAWTSERERDSMLLERDGDDVARCFALERALGAGGLDREFRGEVTGVISAGAFIAFGTQPEVGNAPPYEGMLPVRRLGAPGGGRDWFELNDEGTILRGERTGTTIRLGDPLAVRVGRIDAVRGRVDLLPAG
ncbi:MAG TPA: RNB domain-containing ribonuclease [Solirubrobacteraceae bacterium]|nr:RNB domain-containing ribonuclease [Solirubrobacteraceae bacterium]